MTDVPAPAQFVDERLGAARGVRAILRYVFPDHWSFLIGEMALYAFAVLVATGIFLAVNFEPSTTLVTWHGPYAPLDGQRVSGAYASALDLSFKVPGGLLMRQTHHWAALLFVVAITFHVFRVAFTGAFRKPRELNWIVGVTLLALAVVEGYVGYSLLDDLLSGMGLAIGNATALSLPGVGGALGALIWDGPFPGGSAFQPRLFAVHVFVLPALMSVLIAIHLALIVRVHHAQFRGPGRREANVVGSPLWPGYALRSIGWLALVAGVLFLAGGLLQVNPIWQWGPYEPYLGENGAQPDFYLGWLIGALRLMPNWELHLFGRTVIPNPFFGGVLFPGVVFVVLYAMPLLDRWWFTRDGAHHHLLDHPRDNPRRTGFLSAFAVWVATIFVAGSADRFFLSLGVGYELQVWIFRALALFGPIVAYLVAVRLCRDLRAVTDPLPNATASKSNPRARGGSAVG